MPRICQILCFNLCSFSISYPLNCWFCFFGRISVFDLSVLFPEGLFYCHNKIQYLINLRIIYEFTHDYHLAYTILVQVLLSDIPFPFPSLTSDFVFEYKPNSIFYHYSVIFPSIISKDVSAFS